MKVAGNKFETWKNYYVYRECLQNFCNKLNMDVKNINIIYQDSINCNTHYDKKNDCIIFNTQFPRYIVRCNSLVLDKNIEYSNYYNALFYLFMLNKCTLDHMLDVTVSTMQLYEEYMLEPIVPEFWKNFNFSRCMDMGELQNMILLGHELYHRSIYLQSKNKFQDTYNREFESAKKTIEKYMKEDFEGDINKEFIEEALCDWFAVKTLIQANPDKIQDVIEAYSALLCAICFIKIAGIFAVSMPYGKEYLRTHTKNQILLYESRFVFFSDELCNYILSENINLTFTDIIKLQKKTFLFINNIIKRAFDISVEFAKKNAQNSKDNYIRYFIDPLSTNKETIEVSTSIFLTCETMLKGKLDIFDYIVRADTLNNYKSLSIVPIDHNFDHNGNLDNSAEERRT
ncbi:MAG: hypothetical protein E7570_01920 [Ruminococcaceae bacterium]|nr:hypothetical protein [Oscillospiraceae bacterium]